MVDGDGDGPTEDYVERTEVLRKKINSSEWSSVFSLSRRGFYFFPFVCFQSVGREKVEEECLLPLFLFTFFITVFFCVREKKPISFVFYLRA